MIGWGAFALEFYRVWGRESIPQPHQKFARIDPAEFGGGAIVGAEVIPQTVLLSSLAGGAPEDRAIVVGAVPEDLSESGVHR